GEMGLRPRGVPARGRPGITCKPCWRALAVPMSLYALTRTLRTSCYREQKLVQGRRALNVCAFFVHAVRPWRRRPWRTLKNVLPVRFSAATWPRKLPMRGVRPRNADKNTWATTERVERVTFHRDHRKNNC